MSEAPLFNLRSRKLWMSALALGLAGTWWAALSKKSAPRAPSAVIQAAASAPVSSANSQDSAALPTQIDRHPLEASQRDPFSAYVSPPPKLPTPKKPAAPPVPVIAAAPQSLPAPSPPPLNLRFLGQATTPDGERLIYATLGDTPVLLTKGASLPNGYQVTSIETRFVNLSFAPLNYSAQLALPEPPRYEIR